MKLNFKILTILSFSVFLSTTSCYRTESVDDMIIPTGTSIVAKGSISSNTVWSAMNIYSLEGFVYVESGATLTIEPGTIIKGNKVTKGTLIIKPGGKIIAEGTVTKPIVFTSSQPIGKRNYGDWGGLVILGKAPVNKNPATIEGENVSTFGGSEVGDNSGIVKYVRIEFAGIAFETDKEINGLTFGGVGSGTTIDFVQVSYSGDDSFEWFGGTMNAKHLIAYKGLDDDFDTDWGYSGNVQYAYALRDPKVADQCSCSDSNGFESDNDGSGSDAQPQTSAKFANATIIIASGTPDNKYRSAFRLRRNTALSIYNTLVVSAYPKGGIELQDASTQDNYIKGKSEFQGMILTGMNTPIVLGDQTRLKDVIKKNQFGNTISSLLLSSVYNNGSGKPGLIPMAGSPILSAGVTLPAGFEKNTYIGAFGNTDWTETWTNWDPQNTEY